jgi:chitodextrinase
LTNGASYDFAVRSLDDLGNASAWSEPVSATPFHTDGQSPDVVVTSPADGTRVAGTVDVTADAADDSGVITSLDVLIDGAPAGTSTTTPATVAWDSRTVADGPHQLSASAVDGSGNIGLAVPVSVTVDNTAPPVPTGLVPAPGDGQVTVSFAAASATDLDHYEVRKKPSSSSTWATPIAAAGTSATVTGLSNGASYDFAVRSVDDLGNQSVWSASVSAVPVAPDTLGPSAAVSSPPDNARLTGIVGVAMSAVDDSGVVTRVELLVDGVLVGGASGASTTLQWDTRTVPDGLHSLVARAYDGANNAGLSVPVGVTVDNTAPPVPTGVAATPGDRRVTVSFTAVTAADLAGYDVRMKPSSSSTWGTPVATSTTSITLTGLTNGVSYDFAVRSKDTVGLISAWSGTASAIPRLPDTQAPTAPTRLTVPQRNRTSIQICWTASTDNIGVAGYATSRNGTQVANTTATCFLFTGLNPNTQYTLSVRAYDAAGNFSGSASVSARTRS